MKPSAECNSELMATVQNLVSLLPNDSTKHIHRKRSSSRNKDWGWFMNLDPGEDEEQGFHLDEIEEYEEVDELCELREDFVVKHSSWSSSNSSVTAHSGTSVCTDVKYLRGGHLSSETLDAPTPPPTDETVDSVENHPTTPKKSYSDSDKLTAVRKRRLNLLLHMGWTDSALCILGLMGGGFCIFSNRFSNVASKSGSVALSFINVVLFRQFISGWNGSANVEDEAELGENEEDIY